MGHVLRQLIRARHTVSAISKLESFKIRFSFYRNQAGQTQKHPLTEFSEEGLNDEPWKEKDRADVKTSEVDYVYDSKYGSHGDHTLGPFLPLPAEED